MVRGLYTSVGGMIPRVNQQRNIASNLANQTTFGYKKSSIFLRELITAQYALDHAQGVERTEVPEELYIDFTQGTMDKTDMPFDLALNGNGFFQVRDAEGTVFLTRGGRFYLDEEGVLITSSGMQLLNNRDDSIRVTGTDADIGGNGDVYENGEYRNRINVVDFAEEDYQSLVSVGNGLFINPENVPEIPVGMQTQVFQGHLEDANVEPVMTMVDMIDVFRMFELGQKAIQIQDRSLENVVTDVGRIRFV